MLHIGKLYSKHQQSKIQNNGVIQTFFVKNLSLRVVYLIILQFELGSSILNYSQTHNITDSPFQLYCSKYVHSHEEHCNFAVVSHVAITPTLRNIWVRSNNNLHEQCLSININFDQRAQSIR